MMHGILLVKWMVQYFVSQPRLAPYKLLLPEDMTCWHRHRGSSETLSEFIHRVVLTARATESNDWTLTELEKLMLEEPMRVKRSRAARKAAFRRMIKAST